MILIILKRFTSLGLNLFELITFSSRLKKKKKKTFKLTPLKFKLQIITICSFGLIVKVKVERKRKIFNREALILISGNKVLAGVEQQKKK